MIACHDLVQEKGTCDKDFWIDVLLTILGWLPGCVALEMLLVLTLYACLLCVHACFFIK